MAALLAARMAARLEELNQEIISVRKGLADAEAREVLFAQLAQAGRAGLDHTEQALRMERHTMKWRDLLQRYEKNMYLLRMSLEAKASAAAAELSSSQSASEASSAKAGGGGRDGGGDSGGGGDNRSVDDCDGLRLRRAAAGHGRAAVTAGGAAVWAADACMHDQEYGHQVPLLRSYENELGRAMEWAARKDKKTS